MIRWGRGTARHLGRRGYHGVPEGTSDGARARLSERALIMLRPRLGTAWLDITEPAEGWPPPVTSQAAEATARCSERHDSPVVTVRPGFGPGTVVLNPADDGDFAMLLALAPFSSQVDVMSRDGQLVYASAPPRSAPPQSAPQKSAPQESAPQKSAQPASTPPEPAQRQLVLRLTDQERADLTGRGDPADGIPLIQVPKLNNVRDKERDSSRNPDLGRGTVLFLVVGPAWLIRIADRLLRQPTLHDALRQLTKPSVLLQIVIGIIVIVVGWGIFRDVTSLIRDGLRIARYRRALASHIPPG